MTDMLLRTDGKFTVSIPLLIKSSLIKCILASVFRRSLWKSVLGCGKNDGCNSILSRFIVIVCEFLGK